MKRCWLARFRILLLLVLPPLACGIYHYNYLEQQYMDYIHEHVYSDLCASGLDPDHFKLYWCKPNVSKTFLTLETKRIPDDLSHPWLQWIEMLNWRGHGDVDFSRLKALSLKALTIRGESLDLHRLAGFELNYLNIGFSDIQDFTPLKEMPLESLCLSNTRIHDLSVLEGLPLRELDLSCTQITDLRALQGMPLRGLLLANTKVSDLSPLAGMPLEFLSIDKTEVTNIDILRALPLQLLQMSCTEITDCSALRGSTLFWLDIRFTRIRDLSPLKGGPLEIIFLSDTSVSDLSPLKGAPLNMVELENTPAAKLLPKDVHGKPDWRAVLRP